VGQGLLGYFSGLLPDKVKEFFQIRLGFKDGKPDQAFANRNQTKTDEQEIRFLS
jgi:hypothetical protein